MGFSSQEAKKYSKILLFDFADGNGPVPSHRHTNGHGWVAETAHVSDSVYVGAHACVHGEATVTGDVIIKGEAEVYGRAYIHDQAYLSDHAIVGGCAEICGNATACEHACMTGHSILEDNKKIAGDDIVFNTEKCLECPYIAQETYGNTSENPCMLCLNAFNRQREALGKEKTLCLPAPA